MAGRHGATPLSMHRMSERDRVRSVPKSELQCRVHIPARRHDLPLEALELVCGADFWCNRHCATSPDCKAISCPYSPGGRLRQHHESTQRACFSTLRGLATALRGPGPGVRGWSAAWSCHSGVAVVWSAAWSQVACYGPKCHNSLCRTLELVCGADCWCNRHCATSPVDLEGFWGHVSCGRSRGVLGPS